MIWPLRGLAGRSAMVCDHGDDREYRVGQAQASNAPSAAKRRGRNPDQAGMKSAPRLRLEPEVETRLHTAGVVVVREEHVAAE
jgi:hypothetical protein